jgi:hypothetical protein
MKKLLLLILLLPVFAQAQTDSSALTIQKRLIAKATTLNQSVGHGSYDKLNDGRIFATLVLGANGEENSRYQIYGQYSSDNGNTWTTPYVCIPLVGTQQYNSGESVYFQDDSTLIMIYLVLEHDLTTRIKYAKSTDKGLTWPIYDVTLYGDATSHFDPGADRIVKLKDGSLIYPFSKCVGGLDCGSQNGIYNGLMLKSTDNGNTWNLINVAVTHSSGLVTQTGIYQFETGEVQMYFRARGNVVGFVKFTNTALTTYTELASNLNANNQPSTIKYYPEFRTLVAFVGPPTQTPVRTRLHMYCSYDHGVSWFFKYAVEDNVAGVNWQATGGFQNIIDGKLNFVYYRFNSIGYSDGWIWSAPQTIIGGLDLTSGTGLIAIGNNAGLTTTNFLPVTTIESNQIISYHTPFRLRARVDAIPANNYAPLAFIGQYGGGQYSQTPGTTSTSDLFQVWDGNQNLAALHLSGFWTARVGNIMRYATDALAMNEQGTLPGSIYWNTTDGALKMKVGSSTTYENWCYPNGINRRLTTTDATATTIVSYQLPNVSSGEMTATIIVRNPATNETGSIKVSRPARRLYGSVTLPGSTVVERAYNGDAALSGITIDFFPDPSNSWAVAIRVTGLASTTILWGLKMDINLD